MSNRPNMKARPAPVRPTARPARPMWQSPLLWVGGLITVALAVAIAIAVSSSEDATVADGQETAFAEILGPPLPPLASPDPAIGTEAPSIAATNLDGDRVTSGGDGVARLYGFFAHWCPHCQAELPRTVAWLETHDLPDGVEVVAISTAVDPNADNFPPSEWFAREEWTAEVLVDSDTRALADGFGLTAFPFWVAVDAEGNVSVRVTGEIGDAALESLISGLAS